MKKYMAVEKYKQRCLDKIYARYNPQGRMFPEGLHFLNSWVDKDKHICFQLMESNDKKLFDQWFENWKDLVDFQLYPVD
jgi:Domain of unknown function (DUF3303)